MNNEPIKTDASELGPDDDNVSRLLATLKRVEAPNDFDFRVKARIASGRPVERRPFGLPAAVGYAIPLVLVLMIGAYFGFKALSANNQVKPIVAEAQRVDPAPPVAPPSNTDRITPEPSDEHILAKTHEPVSGTKNQSRKVTDAVLPTSKPGGGSYVDMGNGERRLYPKGLNPDSRPSANVSAVNRNAQISTKTVLDLIGVKGSIGDLGLKVDSVSPNSPAAHSGVKAGDVIEAVDDRPLTEKTFKDAGSGKTLRVRRDGATVQIVIKP